MPKADVLVVGGGHNGLVAAILAATAGRQVTVLERSSQVGGATVSAAVFAGHTARLSRYSYLVSLFPAELMTRLSITVPLASRSVASYTPIVRRGQPGGLLVERVAGPATEDSFRQVTGSAADFGAWQTWSGALGRAAPVLAQALVGPLWTRSTVRDAVVAAVGDGAGEQLWNDLTEIPIGDVIARRFGDDTVRGVVATDALIGTFTSLFDTSLAANRCLLYHVIGRGTGEWLVPVGGMGALTAALTRRARDLGVEIRCRSQVSSAQEDPSGIDLAVSGPDGAEEWRAEHVLAAVAPAVVRGWLGQAVDPPIGAQLKINVLLRRLPRLRSGMDPAVAFAGTLHLEEGFEQLEAAYRVAAAGRIPRPLPAEVYCHSLTDPSVLGGAPGATLTLFGLHTPHTLFTDSAAAQTSTVGADEPAHIRSRDSTDQAVAAALAALQMHLAEPLADCLAVDSAGRPCIDVASTADLERSLGMPGGHIFHGDLSWPWSDEDARASGPQSAAQRYGVDVAGARRILLAGAGSRRGGGVSGLGGAAAVDALLAPT